MIIKLLKCFVNKNISKILFLFQRTPKLNLFKDFYFLLLVNKKYDTDTVSSQKKGENYEVARVSRKIKNLNKM